MSINIVTFDSLLATSSTNITDGGEKVIRNVTRDTREADLFTKGSIRHVKRFDVFQYIIAAAKEDKIKVG